MPLFAILADGGAGVSAPGREDSTPEYRTGVDCYQRERQLETDRFRLLPGQYRTARKAGKISFS